MLPVLSLVTARSWTAGPRIPFCGPMWRLARIAGERNPWNDPVIVSLLPAKTAFKKPEPATVGSIVASTGTVESRALNDSPFWAMAEDPASKIKVPTKALMRPR